MKKMFKNLDLNGVDTEELSKCYCYREYQNCLNLKYDDFTASLTDTYVRAKKTKQELQSEMKATKYKVQLFYENLIEENKKEYERNLKELETSLKRTYEMKSQTERRNG